MPDAPPTTADDRSDDAKSDVDLSGRQLGDYRLLRRLGRGGMADVYLAEQLSLKRQVAFKVLKADLAKDENYVKRFHLEAQAAAALVHANIVQIHEVGCLDGVHYIAQEYVPGQNLREWMARHCVADGRLAVTVMRQVAAALLKAADQGIIHRDIKPENILLTQANEVKVADFGLARVAGDGAMNLTQIGITMGTPLYMSPEQVQGHALDPRSDLYSLGVTCYHLLSGQPPFRGETALGVAVQHLNAQPPALDRARPDLPPGLCRVVHRMLAKKPDERYASAQELLRDLRALPIEGAADDWPHELSQRLLDGSPTAAMRHEATARLASLMRTEAMALPDGRWKKWLAAAMLAAFVIGAAWAFSRREPYLLAPGAVALGQNSVPRKSNVEAQFVYAQLTGSEDALKAVWQYFPADKGYAARARQDLARLYLQKDEYDQALAIFKELAAMDQVEAPRRAFGLAGEFVVYTLQKKPTEAAEAFSELLPMRNRLDPQMRATVNHIFNQDKQAVSERAAKEWEAWLKSLPLDNLPPLEPPPEGGFGPPPGARPPLGGPLGRPGPMAPRAIDNPRPGR